MSIVAATGHLYKLFLLNLNFFLYSVFGWVIRLLEMLAKGLVEVALLFDLFVPLVALEHLASVLAPAREADLKEHTGQERVHCCRIARLEEDELVFG